MPFVTGLFLSYLSVRIRARDLGIERKTHMKVKVKESIDRSKMGYSLAGHVCEVVREEDNSYLLKNNSPYRAFGDPKEIWVWKIDCVIVEG